MAAQSAEYLDEREAAAYMKLSPRTLQRARQTGDTPKYAMIGTRVLYRRSDIDAWIAGKLVSSTSDATVRRRVAA